jgi:hypothetical protein
MSEKLSKFSIPKVREDVTAEWLTSVLSPQYPGVTVTSAKVGELMGHKPNKVRLQLKYNKAGREAGLPPTMVVKGSFPGYSLKGDIVDFASVAEVLTYRDVFSRININHPHPYVADIDPVTGGSAMMLLEDLAHRDVRFFTARDTLGFATVKRFVRAIATYHAETWNSPEFNDGGAWGPDTVIGKNRSLLQDNYFDMLLNSPTWGDSLLEPRGAALPVSLTDQARYKIAWDRLLDVLASCPRVIIHGDEHLSNIFVEPDGTPGFLDPLARVDSWIVGYIYFITISLDPVDRRNWEQPLLEYYLNCLSEFGVDAPGFEEAWYVYRCATIHPLLVWLHNSGKWQPEWANTANTVRSALSVLDHDAFRLLGV